MEKSSQITKLPYWNELTEEEKQQAETGATIRHYRKGEQIHGGNGDCLGQITVLSGEVRTYLLSDEGKEVTLFTLREGDACVLSASCLLSQITFETFMTARQETDILVVHPAAFSRLIENNLRIRCRIYEMTIERFSQVMWTMQQILFRGMDRRLAEFLLSEAERTGSGTIRMTHEQIAEQISSAREVVARMLKQFSADGLVELERGVIRLKDRKGLQMYR